MIVNIDTSELWLKTNAFQKRFEVNLQKTGYMFQGIQLEPSFKAIILPISTHSL